jgi:hypothetical protein
MTSASGARISVVIYDLQQMDEDLLASGEQVAATKSGADRPHELLVAGRLPSVAEIRRRKAAGARSAAAPTQKSTPESKARWLPAR